MIRAQESFQKKVVMFPQPDRHPGRSHVTKAVHLAVSRLSGFIAAA
jgi:hypothetical protein